MNKQGKQSDPGREPVPIKVLLVVNDPGDMDFLLESLDPDTFSIATATDSRQAQSLLRGEEHFKAMAIDISTAHEDMVRLLKMISNKSPSIPCVLLSSFSHDEIYAQSIPIKSSCLLFKHSVSPENLKASILRVIAHQDALDQLRDSRRDLEESEQRFRTMIEKSVDVVVIFNKDSRIRYINPTGKLFFGEAGEGLLPFINGFPVISGQKMMFSISEDDISTRYWEVRVVIIQWAGEASFLATIRDITDWKNTEKEFRRTFLQLERSNKDLETFAYVTSHDLQEPLRTVTGFLSLLERKYSSQLNEQAMDYISRSIKATTRMRDMILSLLDYSRLSTQTQAFKPNRLDEILDTAIENLSEAIQRSGSIIIKDKMPEVWSERNQLIRLFQNLIGNAIKFCDLANPEVRVRMEEQKENLFTFSVSDNGIGIDPQFIPRIFTIFQRLEKKKYPGTGIGLAMCKKIVEYHGGRIWVDSKLGEGSTFYFTLSTRPKGGAGERGKT